MYDGFINAAKEVFGNKVKVVIDRFHVAKLYRGSFDDLRKKEMYRLKKELNSTEYNKLKNVMWILRKKTTDLKEDELATLKLLFTHSPVLEISYTLRNELTDIFDEHISKKQAKNKINSQQFPSAQNMLKYRQHLDKSNRPCRANYPPHRLVRC